MTIKNLYPKARPQSIYNVINGRPELPAASTFSRASIGTYVDANGIIQTAAVNEPRFNYDPETGEFLGLMLEEEGTNYKKQSSDLTDTTSGSWASGSANMTRVNETINGPAGLQQYTKITAIPGNNKIIGGKTFMPSSDGDDVVLSIYIQRGNIDYFWFAKQFQSSAFGGAYFDFNEVKAYINSQQSGMKVPTQNCIIKDIGGGWFYLAFTVKEKGPGGSQRMMLIPLIEKFPATNSSGVPTATGTTEYYYAWGAQCEYRRTSPTSYIPTTAASVVTRVPDAFSLTSSSNFDGGFSLLLDSETTTDDYFYKIKASGTTIAELNNASGTLDWVVNGVSAATNGEYPQVSAIQPGRVRTISSFGAADGTTQQNYLYTQGLSFPTNAIVASGADEVEFGPGQTLKAVYLWNGQLSNTEAVSVIKGEYNIVPNEPIKADSYSFVYNTDPTNVGEASITLPYIVPTVSMRVYWGDGTNSAYEQGVTASHTYPYPGQYRIQIEADAGFDTVRLGDIAGTVTRVDQWAPQHRVGAAGDGFTGQEVNNLLADMNTLAGTIPAFKYTNLTGLYNTFTSAGKDSAVGVEGGPNWNFVPTDIPLVTGLNNTFNSINRYASGRDKTNFPTLTTGPALTDVTFTYTYAGITNFVNDTPFTDSSSVTTWRSTFQGCKLTQINLDTTAATSLSAAFLGNNFVTSPSIVTSNCLDFSSVMSNNSLLTNQLLWDTSNGTNFASAWSGCSNLTSFPLIDTSSAANFVNTWYSCSNLTSFPLIDTSSGTNFSNTWYSCSNLTSFPLIDTSSGTNFSSTWFNCSGLTSLPLLNTSSGINFTSTFRDCSGLTSFPLIDTSGVTSFTSAWFNCSDLTSFPLIDTSSATSLSSTWYGCSSLTSFPQVDTSLNTIFRYTWYNCNNLTSFPLINTSSGTDLSNAWHYCTNLADFPANVFDTTGTLAGTAFQNTWTNCALTAQSIENILVSLDTNGQSNIELSIDGGTNAGQSTWTTAANTAYTNLISKGWTITFNP